MTATQQECPYLFKGLQDFAFSSVLCAKLTVVRRSYWVFFLDMLVMSGVSLVFLTLCCKRKILFKYINFPSVPSGHSKIYI